MLKALAEEAVRNVPEVRNRRVAVLREGAVVMLGSRMAGTGYRLYTAVVVRTMRKVRRGFVRARYAAKMRRRDCFGRALENVVS
jgi:hypothetical protein